MSSLAQQALEKIQSITESKKSEKINESTQTGVKVTASYDDLTKSLEINTNGHSKPWVSLKISKEELKSLLDDKTLKDLSADFGY